jgi:diacylglycerol kinase family enzyme
LPLALSYDFPTIIVSGIDATGRPVEATGTSALVSNCRYWSGANPAIAAADPADDLLEVVVLESTGVAHLLAFWSRMMLPGGKPLSVPGVRMIQMRSLSVTSTAPEVEVHINGDAAGYLPIVAAPAGSILVRVVDS